MAEVFNHPRPDESTPLPALPDKLLSIIAKHYASDIAYLDGDLDGIKNRLRTKAHCKAVTSLIGHPILYAEDKNLLDREPMMFIIIEPPDYPLPHSMSPGQEARLEPKVQSALASIPQFKASRKVYLAFRYNPVFHKCSHMTVILALSEFRLHDVDEIVFDLRCLVQDWHNQPECSSKHSPVFEMICCVVEKLRSSNVPKVYCSFDMVYGEKTTVSLAFRALSEEVEDMRRSDVEKVAEEISTGFLGFLYRV